ncbi:MAG: hypothetical protein HWE10_09880 [Gammaproteobacteria bacterium]|nr:hypothetical protein [Gammaproteobacteria bacterium]
MRKDPHDKTCIRCKATKPRKDFTKDSRRKDGLSSYCRLCSRAKQKTPEAVAARKANRQREEVRRKRVEAEAKRRYKKKHGTLEGFTYEYRPLTEIKAEAERKAKEEAERRVQRAKQREEVVKANPWMSSALTKAEAYRLRYRLDPLFMLKERLKRQIMKKLERDRPEERPSLNAFADVLEAAPGVKKYDSPCSIERILGYPLEDLLASLSAKFTTGMSLEVPSSWQIDHEIPQAAFNLSDPADARECWDITNLRPLSPSANSRKGQLSDKKTTRLLQVGAPIYEGEMDDEM